MNQNFGNSVVLPVEVFHRFAQCYYGGGPRHGEKENQRVRPFDEEELDNGDGGVERQRTDKAVASPPAPPEYSHPDVPLKAVLETGYAPRKGYTPMGQAAALLRPVDPKAGKPKPASLDGGSD